MNYLKPSEASRLAKVSINTIYRMMDIGVLQVIYVTPSKRLILEASLSQYLRDRVDPDFWTKERKEAMNKSRR